MKRSIALCLAAGFTVATFAASVDAQRRPAREQPPETRDVDDDNDGSQAGLILPAVQKLTDDGEETANAGVEPDEIDARTRARRPSRSPAGEIDNDSDGAAQASGDANHENWINLDSVSATADQRDDDADDPDGDGLGNAAATRIRRGMQDLKN